MKTFPVVTLLPSREKSILRKHPWVFSGAIDRNEQPESGIVCVRSSQNEVLGFGFFEKGASLAIRMFQFGGEWEEFSNKVNRAISRRESLSQHSDTYRLVNAEGDLVPGFVADRYNTAVCFQASLPSLQSLIPEITSCFDFAETIVEKKKDGSLVWWKGNAKEAIVNENGVRFLVSWEGGQKTGFFLDQRENRKLLRHASRGKVICNLFCYTGGFSINALYGGAKEVYSVDVSKRAIEYLQINLQLNDLKHNTSLVEDVFEFWNKDRPKFDFIILDPPAFTKHQSKIEEAKKGYGEINRKALANLREGGELWTFSCSQLISKEMFKMILNKSAKDSQKLVQLIGEFGQSEDHPFLNSHPEGEYLKGIRLRVIS